jgi:myo-inositol 2-dehydrogenase / D-chiro-inositol 1-dehydrogenase
MAFRICLIGCGYMATAGHGPMLQKYASMRSGTELAACCDISRDKAESFAASFGFARAFTDIDGMLDVIKPDGVILAVPIELTAGLAVRVLQRRIPLLTEKPPGVTVEEGNAIVAAARAAGVPVSAAFNRRTMPLVETLMQRIEAIGRGIDSVSIEMHRVGRTDPDFSMTAIHDIDLARYLCQSDYRTAEIRYHVHEDASPAADIAILAECESGAVISLGFFPTCGTLTERITVRLPEHTFYLELPIYGSMDSSGRIVHYTGNVIQDVITGDQYDDSAEANGFLGEIASFFDAVRQGRTPGHSVEGCLQSLEVACCISKRLPQYIKTT